MEKIKLTDEQKNQIAELVGQATMQWDSVPTGVFKSTEAVNIIDRIFEVIKNGTK